ncbi:recombinase family protein [Streptomyces sp. 900105755]
MPYDPSYLHLVIPNTQFEAWLYGRASRDPKKRGDSVEDQLREGRALAAASNWRVADEFQDVGISASRHAQQDRDDFEDLLEVIRTTPPIPGVKRILVAYEASRYYRDLEAYVRLRNACMEADWLLCYKNTVYDLSRSDDRRATAQDAINAEGEADDIRDRNIRTAGRTAAAGDPHGPLIFGYRREYDTVNGQLKCTGQYEDETTGPYVYNALVHIDEGKSISTLIRWLNSETDAARLNGRPWTTHNVRLMLLNRAYLGERHHRGQWRKASWPPIKGLDCPEGRAMFNRVTALLTDAGRVSHRGSEVAHLLSLIALCGPCGDDHPLVGLPSAKSGPTLQCRDKKDTSIRERWLDAYVETAVIEWFRDKKKATSALVTDEGDVEAKVTAVQRRINAFEEQLAEAQQQAEEFDETTGRFKLSPTALASLEQRLLPKLEAERAKLREVTGVSPLLLSLLNAPDPDVVWNGRPETDERPAVGGLSLEQKREAVKAVVTVRLWKARSPGVRRIEDGRVTLAFAGEPGFRDRSRRALAPVPGQ